MLNYEKGERFTIGSSDNILLTFDDGPSAIWTPKILNILKKYCIKVVFFVVGELIKKSPDVLKQIYRDGHDIGVHCYTHEDFSTLCDEDIKLQITATLNEIRNVIPNYNVKVFRPPYGRKNDSINHIANKLGLHVMQWTLSVHDQHDKSTHHTIKERMLKIKNGDIILMHDNVDVSAGYVAENGEKMRNDKMNIIEYLDQEIPLLIKKYQFVSIKDIYVQKNIS